MKKIINGKVYDTDKAKCLGANGYSDSSDFHYWKEELYVKRTGEYFLYGESGPASRYAKSVRQNEWTYGEKIIPLNFEDARKWAEEHLSADKYIEIFGEPGEETESESLYITISANVAKRVRQIAQEKGITLSACVEDMLRNAE